MYIGLHIHTYVCIEIYIYEIYNIVHGTQDPSWDPRLNRGSKSNGDVTQQSRYISMILEVNAALQPKLPGTSQEIMAWWTNSCGLPVFLLKTFFLNLSVVATPGVMSRWISIEFEWSEYENSTPGQQDHVFFVSGQNWKQII